MAGRWVRPGYYEDPVLNRSQPYSGGSGSNLWLYALGAVVAFFLVIKFNPNVLYNLQMFYNNLVIQVNAHRV